MFVFLFDPSRHHFLQAPGATTGTTRGLLTSDMLLLLLTVDGLLVPQRRLSAFVDGFNRVVPGFVFPGKKLKLR
jgi:hypothetical protein